MVQNVEEYQTCILVLSIWLYKHRRNMFFLGKSPYKDNIDI